MMAGGRNSLQRSFVGGPPQRDQVTGTPVAYTVGVPTADKQICPYDQTIENLMKLLQRRVRAAQV